MRILHVLNNIDPQKGGVSQAVRTMIKSLGALDVQNEIVCLNTADEPFLKEETITVHAIGPAGGPWSSSPKLIPWLLENLERFDAVIAHGLWQFHGYAAKKAVFKLRSRKLENKQSGKAVPKLFIMPHGMLDPYFQKAEGRKLKAIRNALYWKLVERKIVNGADGILFTCQEEKRLAKEPFQPYHPKKELVVGLGVEEPPPYQAIMKEKFLEKCNLPVNSTYLLFLSRIHEKKGLDLLIVAYKKIIEKEKPGNIPPLIIAGPGLESDYGHKMHALTESSPELKSKIHFTGMLTGDAKWGAFYGCEAFVLPSHQENFGIAVVEAMACNKAVLISNQVNIWQEIEASKAGIIAEDSFAGTEFQLNNWKNLPVGEKAAMGQRARNCFEKNFGMNKVAGEIVTALRS